MQVKVICRTAGCVSEGAVTLLTDPEALVICGYCQIEITDKVVITPAEEPVVEEVVIDTEQIV